jgi:hypothetical protein
MTGKSRSLVANSHPTNAQRDASTQTIASIEGWRTDCANVMDEFGIDGR